MSLFQRIFGITPTPSSSEPDIPFGRYNDMHKTPAQIQAYSLAEKAFEEERHLDTCRYLLEYLQDEKEKNVRWKEVNGQLHFEFVQGSRLIHGVVSKDKIRAETYLAVADPTNIGLLRKLIEQNYALKFCRYALDAQNRIVMITDSLLVDASPMKLNHALRELAILSDRLDDLLLDEFRAMSRADNPVFKPIPEAEVAIKYAYFQNTIKKALEIADAGLGSPEKNTSGTAYLLLQLLFKLDYLLRPEGYIMEEMSRIYAAYFSKDGKTSERKVADLRQGFERILTRSQVDFSREMYRTNSTFSFTKPADHATVTREIDQSLGNIRWYKDHKEKEMALAVPHYIVGYCLYNFSLPKPDVDFLHLYYRIYESDFFAALGFGNPYRNEDGSLNKKNILQSVDNLIKKHKTEYPNLSPDRKSLDFSHEIIFAQSLLEFIKDMNLNKAK